MKIIKEFWYVWLVILFFTILGLKVKNLDNEYLVRKNICEGKGGFYYKPHASEAICIKSDWVLK